MLTGWQVPMPESPEPGDVNGALLWGLTLAILALIVVFRLLLAEKDRVSAEKDRRCERSEKLVDEMAPLLREMAPVLREQTALTKEVLAEVRAGRESSGRRSRTT